MTYEEKLGQLKDELAELNCEAARAMAGKGEALDLQRWRDRKSRLEFQIPLVENKVLNEQIETLKREREHAKAELEKLRPRLEAAAADYDQKLRALQESYEAHGRLQIQAYQYDQMLTITFEELQTKRVELRSLIKAVTGVEEDLGHDGLTNTENQNLLIRN